MSVKSVEPSLKIARIHFAYDNKKLWLDLAERAQFLRNGNYQKGSEIEKLIQKDCADNMEKYQRPVHAFVIFES